MLCAEQARLLVHVAHGAEVPADDLKVGVLAHVVLGHLEHAEVEVGDGTEGPACDEHDRLLVRVAEGVGEAMGGEGVVWRVWEGDGGL